MNVTLVSSFFDKKLLTEKFAYLVIAQDFFLHSKKKVMHTMGGENKENFSCTFDLDIFCILQVTKVPGFNSRS